METKPNRVVVRHFPAGDMTVAEAAQDFAQTFFDKPREIESWRMVNKEHRFMLIDGYFEYAVTLTGLFYNIVRID